MKDEFKKIKTEYEQSLRVALTGNLCGPNIYKIMEILGREEVVRRLKIFIEKYGRVAQ